DSFECPKCGASYTRERRRIGKAVVCQCGNKFLVPPPPSEPQPREAPRPTSTRTTRKLGLVTRRPEPEPDDDSSAEVLPLADVVQPAMPLPAGRWAEPMAPGQDEPLPEAEVIEGGNPYSDPLSQTNDLSSAGGDYGGPFTSDTYRPPLTTPPPPAARKPTTKKKRRLGASDGGSISFSNGVAYVVLFLILPASAILTLLYAIGARRAGVPAQQAAPPVRSRSVPPEAAPFTAQPIKLVRVTKRAASDEFTLEYQLAGTVNQTSHYFWVVNCPQGRIEFPLPGTTWQLSGTLSGKPAAAGNLAAPFTSFVEEQTGGTRTRVSNEVAVTVIDI
ncbi:MAG TPA: hypothetical protein VFI31_12895, partial [Pirellulales bacterium]|nr:hypothetical protein [Pirellulales bacterium]